ncbi:DUF1571 domain-containing protein [Aureliella helgolandensis]|uniref:DUF1571 domain-containing protein n=1 Tax=Aureliella helgolandensis TaxID=2527968 RepID=A0A518G5E6_9BACT|nr:DUF1571 domain-containing protein [Aureliella helgolandensis]QDV23808.1 hypothetical protein Q31a_21130 [Aureliella helgolandensis]
MRPVDRRNFLSISALLGGSVLSNQLLAQEPPASTPSEPVYRVSKNVELGRQQPDEAEHPLDPALKIAYSSLKNIQSSIHDYTAIVIKREQIGGTLGDYEYMGVKVRNRKMQNGQIVTPFSVYTAFLKPAAVKGREAIYIENQNDGKLVAHEGGMKGRFLPTVDLDPHGLMAMRGQRYPITDLGIENLVVKLIEKGERDRQRDECVVEFLKGAKVGGRECTVLSVKHPVPRPYFDFCHAQIFIDNELNIPVRYSAHTWPTTPGGEPQLLEEYTYQNIKLNVGLDDIDFDRNNPKYKF